MARGIQVPFTLNPRDFLRGLRQIEVGLDDVTDELRKIETAGDDAFDDVEKSAEDAADDIETAFRNLRKDVEDEFDRMERAADDVDLDVADNLEQGADSAKRAAGVLIGEIADELAESWGEAVRSGDYGDAIRETFSNLAQIGGAAFGPVGAVGGAIGSVVLTGLYDRLTDTAARERISEATAQLFDTVESAELSGAAAARAYTRGFVEEGEIGSQLQQALGTDDIAQAWQRVGQLAGDAAVDADLVTRALLGQPDALRQVQAALDGNQAAYDDILATAQELNLEGADGLTYKQDEKQVLDDQAGVLAEIVGLAEEQVTANEQALAADALRRQVQDDIADSTGKAKDNVAGTKDKGLPRLKGDAGDAADRTGKAKSDLETMPDPKVKLSVDRQELNAALEIARSGLEVPVWLRVQNQNAVQAAIGGPLSGNQAGIPRAATGRRP